VSRTPDAARRDDLLERAVAYVCRHGLADLSLRPLAKALHASPRLLLYYFGSKEQLIVEIIERGRARQRAMMANLKLTGLSPREIGRTLWHHWSRPEWEPLTRLSFEVYTLALQDSTRFPGFVEASVEEWLKPLEACSMSPGRSRAQARALATVLLAGFRGFLLDLLATHDRARIDRAVDLWLTRLHASPAKEAAIGSAG
jgi:AcrR family transcriptional regulator